MIRQTSRQKLAYDRKVKQMANSPEPLKKLSIEEMLRLHRKGRDITHKRFRHIRTGDEYQALATVIDTDTQTLKITYCLSALPALKYVRDFDTFVEKFEMIKG